MIIDGIIITILTDSTRTIIIIIIIGSMSMCMLVIVMIDLLPAAR